MRRGLVIGQVALSVILVIAAALTIKSFALFYLERIGTGGCTGNKCEVVGRFVRVSQNIGLLAGTFNEASAVQFVRLTQ